MYQLEVVKFKDVITVTGIPRFVPNLEVPTLELIGEDFSSVEAVYINETLAPEFVIVNKNKMWVQLPDSARSRIDTIEVLSSKFTRTAVGSKIEFKMGNNTKKVSGILKLTQLFTKWILQSPGSDVFNQRRGGGLQDIIGRNISTKNFNPLLSTITRAVQNTSAQIRSAQVNYPGLPRDERLLSADMVDLNVYQDKMMAVARVNIVSVAGDEAISALVL